MMQVNPLASRLAYLHNQRWITKPIKVMVLAILTCSFVSNANDLALNGVIDGPLAGGLPKAIQVYVVNDIDDLSRCGFGSANNGGGSDGQEFTFPVVSVSAGDYLYISSESTGFNTFFGFSPNYVSSATNINGDDAIELFCDSQVIDVYGDINTDGTGQAWEYLDGWAYRKEGTTAEGSEFVADHWQYSGKNALDGESTNATSAKPFPLSASIVDDETNSDTGTGDTVSAACFNCPQLTKIADASVFNDASYYAQVLTAINTGLSVSEIKAAMTHAISQNHKNLSYAEVWTALTATDEDPQNADNVILLYKGTSIAKMSNGSGSQSSDPDNWNREHVWAKSHGFPNASQEGYTDIHHLRPADISVNSARGNLDFDNSDSVLSEAPSNKVDSDSFEPRDAVKGDVARMVFYMDTRYEGADDTPDLQVVDRLTTTGEAALGKLCRLIEWHNADPVSEFESHRNNTIYEFQGNRNPFIDHPEWVAKLYAENDCATNTDDGVEEGAGDTAEEDSDSLAALIISEYIEGSSNNKALELFNLSDVAIDLASQGYTLSRFTNGSTSGTTISLIGTVAPHSTFVIVHSSANDVLKAKANQVSGSLSHNGDDAYVLYQNGVVIDSFGRVGEDPGSEWGSDLQSTKDNTLVRKSTITRGDIIIDDAFQPSLEWDGYAQDTFEFLGAEESSDADSDGEELLTLGACAEPASLISSIQGSDFISPVVGESHIIEAVVTAAFPDLAGFFVQQQATDWDDNNDTSEAVFVASPTLPAVGRLVRVLGTVAESYGRTQIVASDMLDCGAASIDAVVLTLPFTSSISPEALEGMYVSASQSLTVTNTYTLARYGELTLSNGLRFNPTNLYAPNSEQAIALQTANSLNQIVLDDINSSSNPANIIYPTGGLTAINTVRLGDQVSSLVGIVDYSYSNYRILPTQTPQFNQLNVRSSTPDVVNGNVKVASMNVLNLFNGDGQGGGFPTARGADSAVEFERQIAKTLAAIIAIDADIIGLMEIENDGVDGNSTLADLVGRLNALQGENTYAFVNTGGKLGNDAIAVAFIYQPHKVSLVGDALVNDNAIFNRPALAQTFALTSNNEQLTVVVNHFKSKGSCSSATGADQDQNDGQACYNARRVAQASELVNWLNTNANLAEQANVLIIGDLNAYAKEDPISYLTNNGFENLINRFAGEDAYSYSYSGEVGYLDHALASAALAAKAVDASDWHINADEPLALDYNLEHKNTQQVIDLYAADAFRMSDHDPLIVTFSLTAETTAVQGDWDADGDVDTDDVRAFMRAMQARASIDMAFDLNTDGIINMLDARAMMGLCTRERCAP